MARRNTKEQRPFDFGQSIGSDYFIGRTKEYAHLKANFDNGINTLLMAPRRYGKTSLVKKLINDVNDRHIKIVYVDAYFCRDEYDFYNMFAESVLKQTNSRFEKWAETAADFLTRLTPKISYNLPSMEEYSVSLGITPQTHTPQEILNLPELIATRKNIRLIVCIDEFQQIGEFADSMTVQKRMRSVWQHHKQVNYCLFGSKKHLLQNMFLKSSYPFYKFGDIVPLEPIQAETWIPYLQRGFRITGKEISVDLARQLCETVLLHPSYVQQYAWLTLLQTNKMVSAENLSNGLNDLIDANSQLFIQQTDSLTTYQLNFLYALLDGVNADFGKTEVREKYRLGAYSNIVRIKNALIDKELIDIDTKGKVIFADPVFPLWLKKVMPAR